jgi:hypothetical protein
VPLLLFALLGALYWFTIGGGRRYLGIVVILLGALLLAVTAIVAFNLEDAGPAVLIAGTVVSLFVVWLGYQIHRRTPPELPDESVLAMLVEPIPTSRSLRPEDVLGRWRFYVDAAASTVTIDLLAGGRYEQVVASNAGDRTEGPGGQWALDGANIELSAYRSAVRGTTDRVRWFFGDCDSDLILFVKDDPEAETMLIAQRPEDVRTPSGTSCGDAAASQSNPASRKAGSRCSSLFAPFGRLGRGGKSPKKPE